MKSRFIQTSESASDYLHLSYFKVSAKFPLHAAPNILIPYSAISIIITIPFSVPNYETYSIHSFYLHFELRCALPLLNTNKFKSFKDTIRNSILMLSLDKTLLYAIYDGDAVVWPSATNISFIVTFPSILMPKYHVHIDVLISRPNVSFPGIIGCNAVKFFKYCTDTCHLFFNCLGPKVIP